MAALNHVTLTGRRALALTSLGALGVVYGDIGTSPLYAMKECLAFPASPHAIVSTPETLAANVLGGCQGTTGPASTAPDGRAWGSRFPFVTIRDQVAVEARLSDLLGVQRWHVHSCSWRSARLQHS